MLLQGALNKEDGVKLNAEGKKEKENSYGQSIVTDRENHRIIEC